MSIPKIWTQKKNQKEYKEDSNENIQERKFTRSGGSSKSSPTSQALPSPSTPATTSSSKPTPAPRPSVAIIT